MARKVIEVKIDTEGRDKGKTFVLTEMDAWSTEAWATEAMFAMLNSGMEIPDDIANSGLAGVAALGVSALTKVPFDKAKPLLDRMMDCVQIKYEVVRALRPDDIEEVSTLLRLRKELFSLHLAFFTEGGLLTSAPVAGNKTAA